MENISFQELPINYKLLLNQVQTPLISNLYSKFSFIYLPLPLIIDEKEIEDYLFNFLKESNFITFKFNALNRLNSN